jgi:DNA-binding PadR family transcriptional regulator
VSADYRVGVELRPTRYYALAALIDGPLHGYAIAQRARELSGGRVRLSTGTLYALLERALSTGFRSSAEEFDQLIAPYVLPLDGEG